MSTNLYQIDEIQAEMLLQDVRRLSKFLSGMHARHDKASSRHYLEALTDAIRDADKLAVSLSKVVAQAHIEGRQHGEVVGTLMRATAFIQKDRKSIPVFKGGSDGAA